jgi:hypothetical protein
MEWLEMYVECHRASSNGRKGWKLEEGLDVVIQSKEAAV